MLEVGKARWFLADDTAASQGLTWTQHGMTERACRLRDSSVRCCRRLAVSQQYAVLSSSIFATCVAMSHVSMNYCEQRRRLHAMACSLGFLLHQLSTHHTGLLCSG